MPAGLRPGVLLDRDGTLNVKAPEGGYVTAPEDVVVLPGAVEAVAALTAAGVVVAVVTNQRGVARGLMTRADVDAVDARLASLLETGGGRVAGFYVCPHDDGTCDCRKPRPGLLLRAVEELGLDPGCTWVVGDQESDVGAATAAGLGAVRLALPGEPTAAPLRAGDLAGAVALLLGPDVGLGDPA